MKATKVRQEFEALLKRKGLTISGMTPSQGVDAMLEFFTTERVGQCQTPESDMLLYQWGTYDWGKGKKYELDITRQLILASKGDDESIWQLHLTFRFTPTEELERLGKGNRWCQSPGEVQTFREFINDSPPFQTVAHRADAVKEVGYECAG